MTSEKAAAIIASAQGESGANIDYVTNTLMHLRNMRVRDHALEHINELVLAAASRQANNAA